MRRRSGGRVALEVASEQIAVSVHDQCGGGPAAAALFDQPGDRVHFVRAGQL